MSVLTVYAGGLGCVYLPPVPLQQVPGWIAHADACAVPYRLNSFTKASSPLKAFEYLAMGAPTLSTRVPCLEKFAHALAWVEEGNGASYALALQRLGEEGRSSEHVAQRRSAVANASIAARVREFLAYV